jgi:hypothetical protein
MARSVYGVVDDGPMVNDVPELTNDPFTIVSTCVAVAVALVVVQAHPPPDLTTNLNSSVLVTVQPGALPRLGGSWMTIVNDPPPGHGIVRLAQGANVGDVGAKAYISVHVLGG